MPFSSLLDPLDPAERLHGALEIFSKEAVAAYAADAQTCEALPALRNDSVSWAEDAYIAECMFTLGAAEVRMPLSLLEAPDQEAPPCATTCHVAFYPFRDPRRWVNCYSAANAYAAAAAALPVGTTSSYSSTPRHVVYFDAATDNCPLVPSVCPRARGQTRKWLPSGFSIVPERL